MKCLINNDMITKNKKFATTLAVDYFTNKRHKNVCMFFDVYYSCYSGSPLYIWNKNNELIAIIGNDSFNALNPFSNI